MKILDESIMDKKFCITIGTASYFTVDNKRVNGNIQKDAFPKLYNTLAEAEAELPRLKVLCSDSQKKRLTAGPVSKYFKKGFFILKGKEDPVAGIFFVRQFTKNGNAVEELQEKKDEPFSSEEVIGFMKNVVDEKEVTADLIDDTPESESIEPESIEPESIEPESIREEELEDIYALNEEITKLVLKINLETSKAAWFDISGHVGWADVTVSLSKEDYENRIFRSGQFNFKDREQLKQIIGILKYFSLNN